MLVSKPKQAGGRDPKNQENNFSTEHIIGMNITKTQTKEQTFMDLILGAEENNKDTTETQGKTTLTTQ